MKTLSPVRLVLFIIAAFTTSAYAQVDQFSTYTGHSASFEHPSSWSHDEGKGVVRFAPASAHIRLHTGQEWLTSGMFFGAYNSLEAPQRAGATLLALMNSAGNPNLTQTGVWEKTTVAGREAAFSRYTNSAPGISEAGLLVVVRAEVGYYYWSIFGPANELRETSTTAHRILRSIRFGSMPEPNQSVGYEETTQPKIYVEPAQTLVRSTVSVSAGQSQWFDMALQQGSVVNVDFRVEGGLNNKIMVWLLDAPNFQRFVNHQQFTYSQGTSGEVKGVGRYSFTVPSTGQFHIVLDNGKAWFMPRTVKIYSYAILPYKTEQSIRTEKLLAEFYRGLKRAYKFPDFALTVRHCGMENAFSNPNITLCTELADALTEQRLDSAIGFVLFHELGHTLLRQWGYPLYDNEDAADEFSTFFIILAHQQDSARAAAQYWAAKRSTAAALWALDNDDRHTLSPQRARNILHWLNQQDELVSRWQKVIIPNMQTEALRDMLANGSVFDRSMVEGELRNRGN